MKKFKNIIAILVLAMLFTTGCGSLNMKPISYTGIALDTVVSIQILDSSNEELMQGCVDICKKYENMLSRTIETSDVYKINHANGEAVEVSPETIYVMKKALYYSELSHGAFDITVGTVTPLWDFKATTPILPDQDKLEEAASHVDYHSVIIGENTVQLTNPNTKIDLGAIAKGYIADKIKEYLISEGVEHALINLGGNALAIGSKLDGSSFNIGIQTPFAPDAGPITAVPITDQSIVTSGTYQRYFEIDGQLYHHILDPANGQPTNNGLSSVTIVTDSSLAADALSTTCFVLGPEKGMELINQLDDVEAIFIDSNNQITYSKNF